MQNFRPLLLDPIGARATHEAAVFVKATIIGELSGLRAHMPFAETARRVAGIRQILGEHFDIALDPFVSGLTRYTARTAPHAILTRKLPGKQAGA